MIDYSSDIMFDFSEFYDRIAKELPDGCRIAEIGVADGFSALYLAERLYNLKKSFTLYMVDNMDYGGYNQIVTIFKNIIKTGMGNFIEVIPCGSVEASRLFNDNDLDFVFIDASHEYKETKDDIEVWYPKVKDLGVLAGHDYDLYADKVGRAVDELIPKQITRNDIPNREFEPEQFLHTEATERNYGVWWCKKDFYKKLPC